MPSFVKMLLRCRATVFSLRTSSLAIARFVLPEATSRSTSTSRGVRPPGGRAKPGPREPRRARQSGPAPRSRNVRPAASTRARRYQRRRGPRHARARSTRTRAASYGASSASRPPASGGGARVPRRFARCQQHGAVRPAAIGLSSGESKAEAIEPSSAPRREPHQRRRPPARSRRTARGVTRGSGGPPPPRAPGGSSRPPPRPGPGRAGAGLARAPANDQARWPGGRSARPRRTRREADGARPAGRRPRRPRSMGCT